MSLIHGMSPHSSRCVTDYYMTCCGRAPLIASMRHNMKPWHLDISYNEHLSPILLYGKMAEARFVFCPSGLGFDTFRLWETLVLGAIPVVESNEAGMDRIYGSLPVLVVRDFRDVTEDMLKEAYMCFQKNARLYEYRHLTVQYWVEMVRRVQTSGSVEQYNAEHPGVNRHCHFMMKM